MQKRLSEAAAGMPASGIRRVAEMARGVEGCISLTLGEPGFDTPMPIREAACSALEAGDTHYPPNAGTAALRAAIAAYEATRQDAPVCADNVLVTCGSTEALACAMLSILAPGDEVIVPSPAFGLYQQQIQLARGVHVPLCTVSTGFQIDESALAACITPRTKAIVLNSPNNPTGVQYTRASLDAVTEACLRHDLFLIFDAVYDRLVYDDAALRPSMRALGERLIFVHAFSKTYAMTGWRVGYCLAAQPIAAVLAKVHAALVVGVSSFSQAACEDIFSVDTEAMRLAYRRNRDMACRALAEMGLAPVRPTGAFYVFPPIAAYGLTDDEFVSRLLLERKVAVVPGHCFGTPGFVRISTCCPEAHLAEGLRRLSLFLQDVKN